MEWTKQKKEIVRALLRRLKARTKKSAPTLLMRRELQHLLTQGEQQVIRELGRTYPSQYGFGGPYYGTKEPNPAQLVQVPPSFSEGRQYVHALVAKDLSRMIQAMRKELGRGVVVISAYRSPSYQALLFLEFLIGYNFNMRRTCRRVAIPGWSEHGAAKNQAVDFDVDVKAGKQRPSFGTTKEYRWLKLHAHQFNFYLSYPRGNPHGVQFEPWHWHWEKR